MGVGCRRFAKQLQAVLRFETARRHYGISLLERNVKSLRFTQDCNRLLSLKRQMLTMTDAEPEVVKWVSGS